MMLAAPTDCEPEFAVVVDCANAGAVARNVAANTSITFFMLRPCWIDIETTGRPLDLPAESLVIRNGQIRYSTEC
jgi:hypothetical protein